MATIVNMTLKKESGKLVTKSYSGINPQATGGDIGEFFHGYAELSQNKLENLERLDKSDIEVPK